MMSKQLFEYKMIMEEFNMTNLSKKIGIGVVIAIVCALAFYFCYWIKTPAYSLNLVRESIQKHDVQTFEKHVDLDTVYSKSFDDTLIAHERITGDNIMRNPFALAIMQAMKPGIVSILKAETLAKIQEKPDETTQEIQNTNRYQKQMAEDLKEKTDFENLNLVNIQTLSQEDNTAIVAVTVHSKKLIKDFDLNIKMDKIEDGTWKVKEITNLVDFLVEVNKAVQMHKTAQAA